MNKAHLSKRRSFARWYRVEKAEVDKVQLKGKKWMFSDEKIFTINGGLNRQNDRVYAISRHEANLNGGNFSSVK